VRAHVLVAEDNQIVLDALRLLLEGHGFKVSLAASVDDAVSHARQSPVDVLLLDLSLGSADGLEVLMQISGSKHMPRASVALTGHDVPELHERAMNAGCCEVWLKPVPSRELIERIERLLR
jgi:CheY-like chemotaxis protein